MPAMFWTGVAATLTVICAGGYLRSRARDWLVMTGLSFVLVVISLLGNSTPVLLATTPIIWACVAVGAIMVRRQHRGKF